MLHGETFLVSPGIFASMMGTFAATKIQGDTEPETSTARGKTYPGPREPGEGSASEALLPSSLGKQRGGSFPAFSPGNHEQKQAEQCTVSYIVVYIGGISLAPKSTEGWEIPRTLSTALCGHI